MQPFIMRKVSLLCLLAFTAGAISAQKTSTYHVKSPDGKLDVIIETAAKISWSVSYEQEPVIRPSSVSLTIGEGEILGDHPILLHAKTASVNSSFLTPIYRKKSVVDKYDELSLEFKGGYGIIYRAYDDGLAYRFFTKRKGDMTVQSEEANFNFADDDTCFIPYVRDFRGTDQYSQSFEANYTEAPISKMKPDTIGFLPVLVRQSKNKKVLLTEADLEDYPGMFVGLRSASEKGLKGVFAPYPIEEMQGGYNMMNTLAAKRAGYIAQVNGTRSFPWRVVILSTRDADLANSDMIQKLASPSRIGDASWVKPGKVSWDWWNDWNISHVDFKAGISTETYKYYIDFAAANKLEYIIMDEGWSSVLDLMKLSGKINLQEIVDYGKQKNIGVILWASWYSVWQKTDEAFSKYAAMGIKGFKIDFMDRDDQKMVASLYTIAMKAAGHHLLIDLHGMYKPTGMQRTFPNVIGFEGVKGMENVKWTPNDDVPRYDLSIPFIRMVAGPMDYTPGAMRNATKASFRPVNSMPMSQGTRCHQLAMYTIYEAPLQMLSDNPTIYMKEQECTDFISKIPTRFDETVALDGQVGEYIALARKKDHDWFVAAMGNWTPRDLTIDLSFLGEGNFVAEIFKDGLNADRDATDYKKETLRVSAKDKLLIHLSNGGGWAGRIYPEGGK